MLLFDRRLFFFTWGYARGRLGRVGSQRTAVTAPRFGLMLRALMRREVYYILLPIYL